MKRRVVLQEQSTTQDAYGQIAETWTDVTSLGAVVTAASLTEITTLNRELNVNQYIFDFSFSPSSSTITTRHRLVLDAIDYDVISVDTNTNRYKSVRVVGEMRT